MKWPELGPELGYRLHYVSTANLEEFTSNGSAYFKFDVGSLYLSTDIIRLLASCPRPLIEPALNHLLSLLFGRRTMRHCRFRLRITRIVMLRWALCLQREGRASGRQSMFVQRSGSSTTEKDFKARYSVRRHSGELRGGVYCLGLAPHLNRVYNFILKWSFHSTICREC